jgi:hypothetical protein
MSLTKHDDKSDERLPRSTRPKTKVEWLWERIAAKQREIRLLEIELNRTDPNEIYQKVDSKSES